MAELVLFHHALGVTPGIRALADQLRAEGHTVHVPDLYRGHVFERLDEGVAFSKDIDFDQRAEEAINDMADGVVYMGISLGVMAAQKFAQTRRGAKGAVLISSAVKPEEFGTPWPRKVPLQIHMMEKDEWVQGYDLDAAHELANSVEGAELFLYPGDRHLFVDSSSPDYDEAAAADLKERVLRFLA
ncbi:MAG TPA: dienelactone hydrolase family protein [Candidatus Dormibacteraeota bacterium]|nr:dienelactone hydrolase family protein [Candidatus Dormibacteraeota bacterium]